MQLSALLSESFERNFVGREAEMTQIMAHLRHPSWQLLHLYGQGGIGKTTLLKIAARQYGQGNTLYLEGGAPSPDVFLALVAECVKEFGVEFGPTTADVVSAMNRLAEEAGGLLLVLDEFDAYRPMAKWLREQWFPLLSTDVRVVTLGRHKLGSDWMRAPGWNGLLLNLPLGPLDHKAMERYLDLRGIDDVWTRGAINRFSRGVPLALMLAANTVLEHGPHAIQSSMGKLEVIQALNEIVLADNKHLAPYRWLIYAAALFYCFDEDLLRETMGEELPSQAYREFCNQPYITRAESGGWCVSDPIRQWVIADFKSRSTAKYAEFRQAGALSLQRRLQTASIEGKPGLIVQMIHLNENELVQSYCFGGQQKGFETRPVRENEIPLLEDIYRTWASSTPPYLPDDSHQEKYIRALWEAYPDSVTGLYTERELAGYLVFPPLDEVTRGIFADNPFLAGYMSQRPLELDEYLIFIGATRLEHQAEALGMIFRLIFEHLAASKLITVGTPLQHMKAIFESIGFQVVVELLDAYAPGNHLWFLQLDLRSETSQFDRLASPADSVRSSLTGKVAIELLKKLLTRYPSLEFEPELVASTYEAFLAAPHDEGKRVSQIRSCIETTLVTLSNGSREDALYGTLLTLTYIQRAGSHEEIAFRLNLSLSTYYRYLRKALERLSSVLLQNNL